jgi:hypothetical protein
MKKSIFKIMLGLFIIGTLFVSCTSDDDSSSTGDNKITVDGKSYELSNGSLEYYGISYMDSSNYNFDVLLYSGFTYNAATEDYSGIGNYIYFELFSSSATELVAGNYSYNASSYAANTFDDGYIEINYNIATETNDLGEEITAGTVNVKKSGNEYEISFDGTTGSGKKITAFYKGSLNYFDYSEESLKTVKVRKRI